MQKKLERVEKALEALKAGKMIILTDNPDRENEGDLVAAAETICEKDMNLMIRHGSGIVCLSMPEAQLKQLNLPLMVAASENNSYRGTPITLSIDARNGISTGVSASDRCKTIRDAVNTTASPDDLVKPGHIFPLQAKNDGVLVRAGHTEGSLDLMKLANLKPAAVLCEIMNSDGTMTRGKQLEAFAEQHQLLMLSIDDIIAYRFRYENMIEAQTDALLPMEGYGEFKITAIKERITGDEHIVLSCEPYGKQPLVRIHSSCATGDLFSSLRCDCHHQLHYALKRISKEGGILIYLNQEGRGIGLFNKIKAYQLQEQGLDTVEANETLGLPADSREYYLAANILRNLNITHVRLLTNNPKKISSLNEFGINKVEMENIPIFNNIHNQKYLHTKKTKFNHVINF